MARYTHSVCNRLRECGRTEFETMDRSFQGHRPRWPFFCLGNEGGCVVGAALAAIVFLVKENRDGRRYFASISLPTAKPLLLNQPALKPLPHKTISTQPAEGEGLSETILVSSLRAYCTAFRTTQFAPGKLVEPAVRDPSEVPDTKKPARSGFFSIWRARKDSNLRPSGS